MIINHQSNIAAFKGAHVYYSVVWNKRISATSAAPVVQLIAQSRTTSRFVFSRVFGRVN